MNAIAAGPGLLPSPVASATYTLTTQVAMPTFIPAPGTYTAVQNVTISTTTPNTTIYYTLDKTIPTKSSTKYSGPVSIGVTETLSAIATDSNNVLSNSPVASGLYTMDLAASSINFGNGFTAGSMVLVGNAKLNGTSLRLTDGGGNEAASAWYNVPAHIRSFTTDFTFLITPGSSPTAEGFTFTIQPNNASAIGSSGGGLGYGGIANSVAIKFDLYSNGGEGVNSTGLYTNGASPTTPFVDMTGSGIDLHSSHPIHAHIAYDGTNLVMTLTDTSTNGTFTNSWPIDIPATVGGNSAYVGFTGGTGGLTAIQDIQNWIFGPVINVDVKVVQDQSTPASSVTTPGFSTAAGNELLLAFISADRVSSPNTTVTGVSGAGLTWVLVQRTNVQSGTAEVWRAFSPGVLSNVTVTASLSQTVDSSMTVMSFIGVDTSGTNGSGAIGATGTGNSNPGAPTATLTTTRNNSLVLGVGNDYDNAIARTPGGNQTVFHQYLAPVGDTYWMQMQNSTTPLSGTSVTINDTAPTGDRYNLSIVEVLPAAVVVPTYKISGTITPLPNGSSVTVTLTPGGAVATSDSSGNYSFSGLANGNYTVTPSKAGFTFTPANPVVPVSGADVLSNFTIQPIPTHAISGTITPLPNGSGVTVNLTGLASATTTTDASGNYMFAGLQDGSYTVTPGKTGFTFTPANKPVTLSGSDAPLVNFTVQTATASSVAVDAVAPGDNPNPQSTVTSTVFSTSASNELLLAFVATDYLGGPNTTVTSVAGAGLTWVLVVRSNTQSGTSEIWRAFAPSPLSNVSVTATVSQSVVSSIVVMSFTGVDSSGTNGSGAIGVFASGNANPGAPTAQLVTTRNNSLVVAVGNDYDNAILRTPGSGQTVVHQYLAPVGDTYWVQRQNASTPLSGTSVTINDTAPTGDRYNLAICEVLAAP